MLLSHSKIWHFGLLAVLVLGLPRTLVQTAGAGLFLSYFPAESIAWVYLATALTCPLLAIVFIRLEARLPLVPLFVAVELGCATVSIALRMSQPAAPEWVAGLAFMWAQVENMVSSLVFWGLANQFFDIRAAKSAFPRIASGEQIGALGVGLSVPILLTWIGSSDLLLLSACSNILGAVLIFRIGRSFAPTKAQPSEPTNRPNHRPRFNLVIRRMIFSIAALTLLSNVAFFLLDNAFYSQAQAFLDSQDAATGFIGVCLAVAAAVSLVVSQGGVQALFGRFGFTAMITGLPVALIVMMAAIVGLSAVGKYAGLIFGLIVAAKVYDESFRSAIYRPSFQALFQPLPPDARFRALTLCEGFAEPLGIATAAALLLGLAALGSSVIGILALALCLVGLVWIVVSRSVAQGYVRALEMAVSGRQELDPAAEVLASAEARHIIFARLEATNSKQTAGLASVAREIDRSAYLHILPRLIAAVDGKALTKLLAHPEDFADQDCLPVLLQALDNADKDLAPLLVAAIAQSDSPQAQSVIERLHPRSSAEALARDRALLIRPGETAQRRHMTLLEEIASGDLPRIEAALDILDGVPAAPYLDALSALLRAEDSDLRHRVIGLLGRIGTEQSIQPLLVFLASAPSTSDGIATVAALAAHGSLARDVLCAIGRNRTAQLPLRRRAIEALGRMEENGAFEVLVDFLVDPDPAIALSAGAALWHGDLIVPRETGRPVMKRLIDEALLLSEAVAVLKQGCGQGLLGSALEQAIRQRCELLLVVAVLSASSLANRPPLSVVMRFGADRQGAAYAEELFEQRLPANFRPQVRKLLNPPKQVRSSRDAEQWRNWLVKTSISLPAWLRLCAETAPLQSPLEKQTHMSLTIIEKVIFLKSVGLFSGIPDMYLAEFAPVIEELWLEEGEILLREGDLGSTLYAIVSGRLHVQRGDRTLASLQTPEIVGELAALDPQPRTADVVAAEPTHLLALSNGHLDMLIASHSDIAQGIIVKLCQRLRAAYSA